MPYNLGVGSGGTSSAPILFPDGTAGAPSISFADDTDNGIWSQTNDSIDFSTGGSHRLSFRSNSIVITSTGGFGWGSGAPTTSLDTQFARRAAGTPVVNMGAASFSSATNSVTQGGVFGVNTTSTATTGTTEEILATITLPANALSANGKGVRITTYLTTAANANSKTARIRFGGIAGGVVAVITSTANAGNVIAVGTVIRSASNTQVAFGTAITGTDGATGTATASDVVPGQTDTAAIDIVITGATPTAAGDLTHKATMVEFFN